MSTDRMQERVNEICNELYSKGEKVSVRVILTFLPDVSSTSTVHKYYANWRKELEANEKSLYDKLGFSSEFTQMFMKEISRFSVEAEQRYKGIADEANEQRDAAIEELAKIEDRLHKQNAVVEQQDKDITHLKSEMVQRESAFEAEVSKLEQSHSVLVSELRQRITQLEKELTESTHTNETLRTELAKSELKLESNQDYVNEVKAKQQQLEERNATLQSDNQSLSQQVTKLSTQLEGSVSVVSTLEKRIMDFETQHSALQSKATEMETHYKSTLSELVETKSQLQNQSQKIGSLEEINQQQKRYIDKLEKAS
ncbi:DNA-binding protein [Vibrio parahaemolyticus]|uniref:DNA-binding protein n=1 Tax=Vibrio parahaemolyticus TaxID=670 RepID=UPI00186A6FDD|nr:DNA-binding protein [Vibrio parahaemolyticus]MBE3793598.1 hypothetical protein [Vibrio parahaemolyticus]MBE3866459.1 hypothetical protein [Vibrio parahaemolyticus]MCC3796983.1 DNA-binding protein [Vibrio parahaemolyticus]MCC3811540.1 DNA-binding protein [Vibrio parahaemolyticus]MDF4424288.1 DNA-binding protein [Vibrio parahaemolyticus]